MRKQARRDDLLPAWDSVADESDWTGLLVGNGASVAVWPEFRYSSLYEVATTNVPHPLSEEDVRLFEAFETENFEQVLAALKTAGVVSGALDLEVEILADRYVSIQLALFDAVHAVHVPWDHVARKTIPRLFEILHEHKFVYSTNYDLLLYWASMHEGGPPFLDYCWNDGWFDSGDTEIWRDREDWTRILFLHGGIHLRRSREGGTRKVLARDGAILDQFSTGYPGDDSPLLISEGESSDKMASIRTSDYLTFAHTTFSLHEGGLVVFGHSLRKQDDHLVAPMKSWRGRGTVAISMRQRDDREEIVKEQDRFMSRLSPMKDVVFFDAATHPLGHTDLAAVRPEDLFKR